MPQERFLQKAVRRLTLLLSAAAGAVAFLAALGTLLRRPWLATLGSGQVPMSPLGMGLVVLLSLAVLAAEGWSRARGLRRLSVGAALGVALLSLGVVIGHLLNRPSLLENGLFLGQSQVQHTSLLTALATLCAALSALLQWPFPEPAWRRRQGAAVLALVPVMMGTVVLVSYVAGAPVLYGTGTIPMSLPSALCAVGLGMALTLAAGFDVWPLAAFGLMPKKGGGPVDRWYLMGPLVLFLLLGVLILTAGSFYLRGQLKATRARALGELAAIAELKVRQIEAWSGERRLDAEQLFEGPLVQGQLRRFLAGAPQASEHDIRAWMEGLQRNTYQRLILADGQGRIKISVPEAPSSSLDALDADELEAVLRVPGITVKDLHRDADHPDLHLSLWVPIGVRPGTRPEGVLLLLLDPKQFLYPLVQSWPTQSPSAETLLVRREGDEVLFLNELRHGGYAPMTLRLPLATAPDMPAARAARGEEGVVTGRDYRGVPVLAALHRIPGTAWHMVAKVDEAEIYGPLRQRVWITGAALIGLLALAAATLGLMVRHHDADMIHAQLALSQRFEWLMREANDIILLLDGEGRILEANLQAAESYGYSVTELRKMKVSELRPVASRSETAGHLERLQAHGSIRFETLHCRRDGSTFPVEVSARAVHFDGAPGVISFLRDITERVARERELQRMTRLYAALSQVNQAIVWSSTKEALLDKVCEVLIEFGQFSMAWIGWNDALTRGVTVAAQSGDVKGYLGRIRVESGDSILAGGPVGTAIREARPCVLNDFLTAAGTEPWRDAAAECGFAAVAAFPIRQDGGVVGALAVYAREKDFFGPQEEALLVEAAMDISFALDHLAGEARRREAEAALLESERFLREAQEAGGVGTYTWDIQADHWKSSPHLDRIFGIDADYPRNLVGWTRLVAPAFQEQMHTYVAGIIERHAPFDLDYPIVRISDGELRWVHGAGELLWNEAGQPVVLRGVIQDITESRAQARQLERLTQLYAALSQVNQAIVWSPTREALLAKICEVMVAFGQFSMAWIGWDDPSTHEVRVLSHYGDAHGYLDGLQIRSDDTLLGRGATGTAIREGRPCVMNDFLGTSTSAPWHAAAVRCGYAASAAFPIRLAGEVCAALMVYSSEKDFFGAHEVALLEEAAGDVSFALDHLAGEDRRRESEAKLRKISVAVEQNPLSIVITDPQGTIEYINPAFTAITGYSAAEALGQNPRILKSLVTPPEHYQQMWETLARGEVWVGEFENLKKGGEPYYERATIAPVRDEAGILTSYIAIKEDITQRKRDEEERRALEAQLHQSQKLESLGSLAGGVAHDMNNVLGAILGLASTLREAADPFSSSAKNLDTIMSACLRGRGVVKSLLYFAHKDLQEEQLIDLNGLVTEMSHLLSYTMLKRVQLRMDLQDGLGLVRGDNGALSHALMNLCVNAMDAMPDGGVLYISTRETADGGLELRVKDTGQGMSPEVLARAMEPFFTTKPQGKGTGLGLAMVYGTMKAHDGTLELLSQPGEGTEAILRFPAHRVGRPAPVPSTAQDLPKAEQAPLKVLLVDDDELIRESVAPMLEMLGHAVTTAPEGQEALRLLQGGLPVDLVILDMNMPGLSGPETLPRIRDLRPGLPVLMATGYSDQEIAPLLEENPGVASLRKPFSMKEIQKKIADLGIRPAGPSAS
ncbi:PAS domain S-box protein [Geothrix sp.]|jgi:PAS domain S-box-containing protein|uniref:PAS domain S-box protein n=1 Tax=Geothrix sp. TaxID=1962974 RepID=UPI0025C4D8B3|nr:PAS domain S-box protein [Geothrix sp.]